VALGVSWSMAASFEVDADGLRDPQRLRRDPTDQRQRVMSNDNSIPAASCLHAARPDWTAG
jgi:hypothetical protein